jgi:hypothetical protein
MFVNQVKMIAAIVTVLGCLALDAGAQERGAGQARRAQAKDGMIVSGALQSVAADQSSVTVTVFSRAEGQSDKTFALAKDAKVLRDGKAIKLADLKSGGRVALKLSPDQKSVVEVRAVGRTSQAPLKAADAEKGTITITLETRQGKQDKTYAVAKDAKLTVDGKAVKLGDLKAGTVLFYTFSAEDNNTIIQAQTARRRGQERNER